MTCSNLSAKDYQQTAKLFGLNFYSIKSLVNKRKGNLIADFMIIPAHGNNFVYPYNPIYDYNSHQYRNCLVLMFLCFESEGKMYPIVFDYWISQIYYGEDEKYLTKNEIFIKSLEYISSQGLIFENILFDAGMFHKDIVIALSSLGIDYVSRFPKGRIVEISGVKQKAKEVFSGEYNGNFYYYHRYQKFFNYQTARIFGTRGKLVGIANNRSSLLTKELFYLFSSRVDLTAVQIFSLYKCRWKIESFFKILKSYLSLSVFYRNDYEYVDERIKIALAGFLVIQEMASKLRKSFAKTLKLLQEGSLTDLYYQSFNNTVHSFYYCV